MENKKTLTFLFNNKEKYEIDIDNKNLKRDVIIIDN